jgi:predicted metal-dependent phosphoesterase TrpH
MEVWRMKAITLRNLPPEVARTVQQRAKQKKTCVNKAVIELLEESAEGKAKKKAPARYHDLDYLVGTWTKEEADAFDKLIAEQRTIDPGL